MTWPGVASRTQLQITLDTAVPPEQADIRLYNSVPRAGIPTDTPRVMTCILHRRVQRVPGCRVVHGPRATVLVVEPTNARLVIANVRWYLPLAETRELVRPPSFDNKVSGWLLT
jgi:hypothetical protein